MKLLTSRAFCLLCMLGEGEVKCLVARNNAAPHRGVRSGLTVVSVSKAIFQITGDW